MKELSKPEKAQSNSVPKKPAASESLYLRAAFENQFAIVQNIPPTKYFWDEYERLRELARRLRRMAGFSPWVPVLFAAAIAILFLLWLFGRTSKTYFYTWPDHALRIVQNLDPCDSLDGSCGRQFLVQAVDFGVPKPATVMHFRDPQHFEAGMTFSHISFKYIGSEAVTDGWDVVRDFEGLPVLAPNCKPDYSTAPTAGHIRCEGGKARF